MQGILHAKSSPEVKNDKLQPLQKTVLKCSMAQTALWRTLLKTRAEGRARAPSEHPQGGADIVLRSTSISLAILVWFW